MIGLQELTSRKSLSWLEFADVIFGGTSDSRKYVCVRRLILYVIFGKSIFLIKKWLSQQNLGPFSVMANKILIFRLKTTFFSLKLRAKRLMGRLSVSNSQFRVYVYSCGNHTR